MYFTIVLNYEVIYFLHGFMTPEICKMDGFKSKLILVLDFML